MRNSSIPISDEEMEQVVKQYANRLFKLCFALLGNHADAEDAVSDTFFKYMTKSPAFQNEEHQKAWLFKVASNRCRDMHRFFRKNPPMQLEEAAGYCVNPRENHLLEEMMLLPLPHKMVLHLFYIEGYKTEEIAQILSISPSAARKRLQYAREKLKLEYKKEELQ